MIRRTTQWTWLDSDWHISREHDVDKQGWEYGDNQWKHFGPRQGLRAYTRRRIWTRAARLEERVEEVAREDPGVPAIAGDGALLVEKLEAEEGEVEAFDVPAAELREKTRTRRGFSPTRWDGESDSGVGVSGFLERAQQQLRERKQKRREKREVAKGGRDGQAQGGGSSESNSS